jgi:hypothetical protein
VNIDWERKREQVRRLTSESCRIADLWTPPPAPSEDEQGFSEVRRDAVKGPDWKGPQDDGWKDGEHWSWLFGDSLWGTERG